MADKPVDKNRLSFKDFHTTEYRPGEDEHTNYRAYRRKRTNESFGAAAAGGAIAMKSYLDKNRDDEDRRRRDDEERRKKRDSETTKKASKPAKQKKQYRYLLHISDRPFTKALEH